jgi:hypothetical protein
MRKHFFCCIFETPSDRLRNASNESEFHFIVEAFAQTPWHPALGTSAATTTSMDVIA